MVESIHIPFPTPALPTFSSVSRHCQPSRINPSPQLILHRLLPFLLFCVPISSPHIAIFPYILVNPSSTPSCHCQVLPSLSSYRVVGLHLVARRRTFLLTNLLVFCASGTLLRRVISTTTSAPAHYPSNTFSSDIQIISRHFSISHLPPTFHLYICTTRPICVYNAPTAAPAPVFSLCPNPIHCYSFPLTTSTCPPLSPLSSLSSPFLPRLHFPLQSFHSKFLPFL